MKAQPLRPEQPDAEMLRARVRRLEQSLADARRIAVQEHQRATIFEESARRAWRVAAGAARMSPDRSS